MVNDNIRENLRRDAGDVAASRFKILRSYVARDQVNDIKKKYVHYNHLISLCIRISIFY